MFFNGDFWACCVRIGAAGLLHPVRGHGLTLAYLHCIDRAIEDNVTAAYLFEDDGRLATPRAATRLCGQAGRDAFAMTLPEDALAVFIGTATSTSFRTVSRVFLTATLPCTRWGPCSLGGHADRGLIGAFNPMLL